MDIKKLSLTMGKRLKDERERRGLSHEKLRLALMEKYGIEISKDSLINYEVSDEHHTKACKNNGMRVEYLRYFADFYGVSADYLMGISDFRGFVENEQSAQSLGIPESFVRFLMFVKKTASDRQFETLKLLFDSEHFRRSIQVVIRLARIKQPRSPHPNGIEGSQLMDKSFELDEKVNADTDGQYTVCKIDTAINGELFLAQSRFIDAIEDALSVNFIKDCLDNE